MKKHRLVISCLFCGCRRNVVFPRRHWQFGLWHIGIDHISLRCKGDHHSTTTTEPPGYDTTRLAQLLENCDNRSPVCADGVRDVGAMDERLGAGPVIEQQPIDLIEEGGMVAGPP